MTLQSFTEAEIAAWKSYYQVVEADTFQSKLYPLLLMCLNPALDRVKFVLEFVRYGVSRSVEYKRNDVPWLKELARRERERQKKLHEAASARAALGNATPGKHCTWCPLLLGGCPLAQTNLYGNMSPSERLAFAIWLQEAEKQNTKVLKDVIAEGGPATYRDANNTEYAAGFLPSTKRSYRYAAASAVLNEWFREHPDEREL